MEERGENPIYYYYIIIILFFFFLFFFFSFFFSFSSFSFFSFPPPSSSFLLSRGFLLDQNRGPWGLLDDVPTGGATSMGRPSTGGEATRRQEEAKPDGRRWPPASESKRNGKNEGYFRNKIWRLRSPVSVCIDTRRKGEKRGRGGGLPPTPAKLFRREIGRHRDGLPRDFFGDCRRLSLKFLVERRKEGSPP